MIKQLIMISVMLALPSAVFAGKIEGIPRLDNFYNYPFLYDRLQVPFSDMQNLTSHPVFKSAQTDAGSYPENSMQGFPVTAATELGNFEKIALQAYLNNPSDARLSKILALYSLSSSILNKPVSGESIRYTIFSQYFLERSLNLDSASSKWVSHAHKLVDQALHNHSASEAVYQQETNSHKAFLFAFNHEEGQRIQIVDQLLEDYSRHPGNALTSAYLTAANIWVGGEAEFSDPSVLYSFVLSSYFSVRSVAMSERLEKLWLQDPESYQRVRLAPILGGWTVPARRWLAQLHGDSAAVETLDAEHDEWFKHYPAFHAASIGLMYFNEPEHLMQGWDAWWAGFGHCIQVPTIRACLDRPRFSFNNLSYFLGAVDYMVKLGELEMATQFLSFNQNPAFGWSSWDYGRDAWEYRQANLEEIFQLYRNDDPSDDPTNFLLKQHQWGPDTITCQYCHQVQSRQWAEEDVNTVYLPDESIATLYDWPEVTTTWFGGSQASAGDCSGIEAWSQGTTYGANDTVRWNGAKYTAKWWNVNQEPRNPDVWDVWNFDASCYAGAQ
ncbi:carbohydrate-binding protein [Microbulbifer sp. SA54]|uniref:carbohydrate-binding protein n=1 Tax=Microbulbifer sp. SA54 TaxID=3401577 RepID=UPI003AAD275C